MDERSSYILGRVVQELSGAVNKIERGQAQLKLLGIPNQAELDTAIDQIYAVLYGLTKIYEEENTHE